MLSRASSFKLTKPKSRREPYNLDIPKKRTGFQTGLTVKKFKMTTIRQESNELSKCIFRENVTLIFVIPFFALWYESIYNFIFLTTIHILKILFEKEVEKFVTNYLEKLKYKNVITRINRFNLFCIVA